MRSIVLTSKRMSRGMAGSKLRLFFFLEPLAEDCLAELFFAFFAGEGSPFFLAGSARVVSINASKDESASFTHHFHSRCPHLKAPPR